MRRDRERVLKIEFEFLDLVVFVVSIFLVNFGENELVNFFFFFR